VIGGASAAVRWCNGQRPTGYDIRERLGAWWQPSAPRISRRVGSGPLGSERRRRAAHARAACVQGSLPRSYGYRAQSPQDVASGPATLVTVNGTGFAPVSVVQLDGADVPTTFINATQLTVLLSTDALMPPSHTVQVRTPAPGGGVSNTASLADPLGLPTVTRLSAATVFC